MLPFLFLLLGQAAAPSSTVPPRMGPPPKAATVAGPVEDVTLGPIFRQRFMCAQHPMGELDYAGDALGSDCMVTGGVDGASGYMKFYRTDGKTNEDWFGWRAEVLAPVSGTILGVLAKPETNVPGTMGPPPAAQIRILTDDGIIVVMAHLTDFRVKPGDRVTAGQVIALDGNNGMARNPHVHIGAWRQRDTMPLQIRWDLRALAATDGK
jgi:hypothetical protein